MQHTADAVIDGQGRITIPPHLARLAGIEREILFVGAGDVIEMWDPTTHAGFVGEAEQDFDQWLGQFL